MIWFSMKPGTIFLFVCGSCQFLHIQLLKTRKTKCEYSYKSAWNDLLSSKQTKMLNAKPSQIFYFFWLGFTLHQHCKDGMESFHIYWWRKTLGSLYIISGTSGHLSRTTDILLAIWTTSSYERNQSPCWDLTPTADRGTRFYVNNSNQLTKESPKFSIWMDFIIKSKSVYKTEFLKIKLKDNLKYKLDNY